jgi:hypothetical protein
MFQMKSFRSTMANAQLHRAGSAGRFAPRCAGRSLALLLAVVLPLAHARAEPDAEKPGAAPQRFDPVIELPEGEGKQLVLAACTRCHTLEGLPSYKAYWGRTQWFDMVESMVKNGAVLDPQQMQKVTDYLTANFGTGMKN